MSYIRNSLLLELPVPFMLRDGDLYFETQAVNGINRWLDNFSSITICAPLVPSAYVNKSTHWTLFDEKYYAGRVSIRLLPFGYHPLEYFRRRGDVRNLFRELIPCHQYLLFCNLGWLGAWGNIGAEESKRLGRIYGVWLDWVLHMMPFTRNKNPLKAAWKSIDRVLLKHRSLWAIRNSALGLFHGRTVYSGYSEYCVNPQLVHDVHVGKGDMISTDELNSRLQINKEVYRISYVGRVHPMKDPMAWIHTIERLISLCPENISVVATWLGEGPLLEACRSYVLKNKLDSFIKFPGAEFERAKLLQFLKDSDIFMFCHITPESPRCLIEALMSGLPLLGYESEYAQDLVGPLGGGAFVPIGSVDLLAEGVLKVLKDNVTLSHMTRAAREAGEFYSDVAVFQHRSDLIKKYL